MKVQALQTQAVTVDISKPDILHHAIQVIRDHYGFNPGEFLKTQTGEIRYDDPDHRHGSIQEFVRKKATPEEVKAFEVLNYLDDLRIAISQ